MLVNSSSKRFRFRKRKRKCVFTSCVCIKSERRDYCISFDTIVYYENLYTVNIVNMVETPSLLQVLFENYKDFNRKEK